MKQQIVISGVGGQGVLFITRLLAEAAILKGYSVITSETHGMAQRGGTVMSHLKVGGFTSPLIRPGLADGLLALKEENISQHGSFVKNSGWILVNSPNQIKWDNGVFTDNMDAESDAKELGNPKALNLILLGFALKKKGRLFCTAHEMKTVLENRLKNKPEMLNASLLALGKGAEL